MEKKKKERPILGPVFANLNWSQFEFRYVVNGIFIVLSIYIHKHKKQNNLAEYKPRIEMGKMEVNGLGILALWTATPLSFFFKGVAAT